MVGFLLAFIATVLVGLGARDQILVAGIAARQDQRPALLLVALVSAALAAAAAVWLASSFAPQLEPAARRMLAVLALGLAAIEMIALRPKAAPSEPTESLGAFGLVLLALQLLDAARFLLFGIVVASVLPGAAGLGGALGGMAVVAIGWAGSDSLTQGPLAQVRRWLGLALLVVAASLFFRFRQ
jgi:Ca2+/H+ antiporter, TMEM165/GDT1 family